MKILDIDIGNTFLKWRTNDAYGSRGRVALTSLEAGEWPLQVERLRVASVAGDRVNQVLREFARQRWGVDAEFAMTSAAQAGVVNSYKDPARMGVDRWLAILSAYALAQRSCWVVDCGSAITVEQIADNGQHLGGYIIPGLQLMSKNLLANTAEIIVDHSLGRFDCSPGVNTSEAVQHGINLMVRSLAEQVNKMAGDQSVFITGGDAELFCSLVDTFVWSPDLVMDGLELSLG
ncbi:MAG: type III pantothenate kinase [Amphritea sp.]